jgi:thymidine phosphorylase
VRAFLKTEAESGSWPPPWWSWAAARGRRGGAHRHEHPAGLTVGNALEVAESLEVLAGGGPADVVELTVRLAAELLELAGIDDRDPAQTCGRNRDGPLPPAGRGRAATWTHRCRSVPIPRQCRPPKRHNGGHRRDGGGDDGVAARRGPGTPRRAVQSGAGVRIHRKPGEPVAAGEPLFTLYTDTPERAGRAGRIDGGWSIADVAPPVRPLIIDRIG